MVPKRLESACRKALYDYDLLEGASSLAIALSGGKDSITMLKLLRAILGNGFPDIPLHAIHVTGEFSCGASVTTPFIQTLCNDLGVPLTICESTQKRETLACYSCSRERRRLIFDAAKSVGATAIAFGHHQDDSVETLLMNLLHKAEFAATLPKVPMHAYGVTIIRPLIYIAESQITQFARDDGFARITCRCPVGQTSQRRATKTLIQTLEAHYPNARTNLAKAAHTYGSQKAAQR
jgi:tRNA(Ile)-lysidine synthase TilS/MesJ